MNLGIVELAVGIAILVAIVLYVRGSFHRWRPDAWAHDMGLELTPRNEDLVRSYLTRTRTFRAVGALVPLAAPSIYSDVVGEPPPAPFDFGLFNALIGYLLGAVLAELVVRRPRAEVPTASLVPRRVADYLPARLRTILRVSAAAGIALIPLSLTLPDRPSDAADLEMLPPALILTMSLVILVGVELLQRYIVGRPQPAVEDDLLRADDAIRSASVHALAGAGIALELLIVAVEIGNMGFISDIQILRWTLPWIGLVCFLASLASWVHITRPRHWRVGRTPLGAGA
jgi:hypothetical protein